MSSTATESGADEGSTARQVIRLDAFALAGASAVVSMALMALLGVFGAVGMFESAVEAMQHWHAFFEPTLVGTLAGMVEAAVVTFVFVYAIGVLYNTFAR